MAVFVTAIATLLAINIFWAHDLLRKAEKSAALDSPLLKALFFPPKYFHWCFHHPSHSLDWSCHLQGQLESWRNHQILVHSWRLFHWRYTPRYAQHCHRQWRLQHSHRRLCCLCRCSCRRQGFPHLLPLRWLDDLPYICNRSTISVLTDQIVIGKHSFGFPFPRQVLLMQRQDLGPQSVDGENREEKESCCRLRSLTRIVTMLAITTTATGAISISHPSAWQWPTCQIDVKPCSRVNCEELGKKATWANGGYTYPSLLSNCLRIKVTSWLLKQPIFA